MLLLSSEFFYEDMDFLAVADVDFCDPITDYIFKWEIGGFDSTELETVIGNSLWFPSGTFKAGNQLEVVVKVLNAASMTMASVSRRRCWTKLGLNLKFFFFKIPGKVACKNYFERLSSINRTRRMSCWHRPRNPFPSFSRTPEIFCSDCYQVDLHERRCCL